MSANPNPSAERSMPARPHPLTFVVNLGGPWRLFTDSIPGHHMMGTVEIGTHLGALAKSSEGRWVQIIDGVTIPLPQHEAAAAVEAARADMQRPIRFD